MSKQFEAKEKQGYQQKPFAHTCFNCTHFTMRSETIKGVYRTYNVDKDLRCSLGGFAVIKTATCKLWHSKYEPLP